MRKTLDEVEQKRAAAKDPAEVRRLEQQSQQIKRYIAEMNNYTPSCRTSPSIEI